MAKHSFSNYTRFDNISSTRPTSIISLIAASLRLGTMYSINEFHRHKTSFPYTNMNGVWHVNFWQDVWYSHSTTKFLWSQSSLWTLQIFVNAFSRILLNASTTPFSYGWYGAVFMCWICNSSVNYLVNWLAKCVP